MHSKLSLVLATLALAVAGAVRPAAAQTTAAGPYYATPSWDQTLSCTALTSCPRFIVLSNMGSRAVLDRETGLVWERTPQSSMEVAQTNADLTWNSARALCLGKGLGGRRGWRLPSITELTSLMEPDLGDLVPGGALPAGHPFSVPDAAGPGVRYWSATSVAGSPGFAWAVTFRRNSIETLSKTDIQPLFPLAWCVRGGMNADQY